MSASRCIRCALEAARPAKRIQIQAQPLIQSRTYAHPSAGPNAKKSGSEIKPSIPEAPVVRPSAEQLQQQQPKQPIPRNPIATAVTGDDASNHASAPEPQNAERSSSNAKPYPPNVLAAFRTPYKHKRTHGIPVASLQLRSYSVRNLEFFADFALRVAYYLKLPASGPVPLPKKTERWTMPKSNFVHKKSQENFERITLRRMITIYDGHPEVVEVWLAALRRWQFYGVGMKANVWQFEGLDVAAKLDKQAVEAEKELDAKLANFGWNNDVAGTKSIGEMLRRQGGNTSGAPMMEVRDEIKGAKNIDLFRDVK